MPPVNIVAVIVAAIASWLTGAAWYGILGRQWMAALDWNEADLAGPGGTRRPPIGPLLLAFFAQVLMALMLAGLIGHIGPPNIVNGIVSGALVWLGFVVTTNAVNYAFQKRKPMLTVIDSGHWLLVLVVQGIMIGLLG